MLTVTVGACSSSRQTLPDRTATEQLLISAAIDRAAESIVLNIPNERKVFVDTRSFGGYDSKYAIATVRDSLLKQGIRLTDQRDKADVLLELRAGAMSIDETQSLFGIPSTELPIPLAGQLRLPEIALFKKQQREGVVKIAATAYDAKTGALIDSSGPKYGYSHRTNWIFLLFFSRTTDDLKPEENPWWEW